MQKLKINGKDYQVNVPNEMPLLWAIRAASIPACPPPTTTKSYLFFVRFT